ncbi:MAG: hypothetical protein K2H18_05680, partial [Muribaculaceae bacterium]|nr:hypothetical protein [Muribaculaceae bacterium]
MEQTVCDKNGIGDSEKAYALFQSYFSDKSRVKSTNNIIQDIIYSIYGNGVYIKGDKIDEFSRILKFMPIIRGMEIDEDNLLGMDLTSDELYKEALKLLPKENIELMLDDQHVRDLSKISKRAEIYLLRSALWGNIDAMNRLIYITALKINSKGGSKSNKIDNNYFWSKTLYWYISDLEKQRSLEMHKDLIGAYKEYFKSVRDAHKKVYDKKEEEIYLAEAEKKRERTQFWTGLIGSVLTGVAQGVNTYMQVKSGGSAATAYIPQFNYAPSGSSATPVADMMSNPNYFSQMHQQLMVQSLNQVQQQEMQEYNLVRQNYQRMGSDLSFQDYMVLKGQAISDMNSNSSSSNVSGSSGTGNHKEQKKKILNKTVGEKCVSCGGSGKCQACNGTKTASSFGNKYKCNVCG